MAESKEVAQKSDVYVMPKEEFWNDIKDSYCQKLANSDPSDVYPSNNPGPELPDGSVNFECHCVGHLVASPCGYEFREAITCQKASSEKEMESGACGEQLMAFMECAMRTQCFKTNDSNDDKSAGKSKVQMMQVPDHLSVTGADLMQIDPLNKLMNKFEATRNALMEKMSVPEHITVNGTNASLIFPLDRRVHRSPSLMMEVPNHLNVFDLSDDVIQRNNNQKMSVPSSLESSNVQNPYEEVKMMQKRIVVLMARLGVLENQVVVQKRREKGLLLALIGAVITMAYSYFRR
ncbi:unnamed protein product [Caenorhabditis sp. 36 PRJEB53466]|nr:unnamed protein product [Caenorhabditis sp. 36 PRJEB53466]